MSAPLTPEEVRRGAATRSDVGDILPNRYRLDLSADDPARAFVAALEAWRARSAAKQQFDLARLRADVNALRAEVERLRAAGGEP